MAKISRRVLKYRERQRRGAVMRPSTFAAIERRAAAGGAYDPEAVAGAAYWKTLAAKYRGNPSSVYNMAVHLGYPYLRGEGKVAEDGRTWLSRVTKNADGSGPALFVGWDQTTRKWVIEEERGGNPDLEKTGGLHIVYSAPNQAYFLMWYDSILRIFPTKAEAKTEMEYLLRKAKQNPRGRTVPEILRECDEVRAALRHRMRPGENPFDWREQRQHTGGEGGILDSIRHGDKVTILVPAGIGREGQEYKEATGRAVMRGPHGWVLNMGGRYGRPAVASESNIVKVRKSNPGYFSETHRKGGDCVVIWANTEAGPYHVQPYVNDCKTWVRERGKGYKTLERARKVGLAWLEDVGRKSPYSTAINLNPDDELAEAGRLYETFHGREPREILELTDSAVERGEYVNLGDLVELTIVAPDRNHVKVGFKDDGVRLASTAEGTQLVLIGGNQDISRTLGMFGAEDTSKDLLDLGDLKQIVYDAAKWQTDFTPQEWKHDLGEESGIRPRVLFNQLKKRIFFAGGTYRVERPGIVD